MEASSSFDLASDPAHGNVKQYMEQDRLGKTSHRLYQKGLRHLGDSAMFHGFPDDDCSSFRGVPRLRERKRATARNRNYWAVRVRNSAILLSVGRAQTPNEPDSVVYLRKL